jgi:lactate dehydrogenase-like 2-hydroxyacid dehydrogenase
MRLFQWKALQKRVTPFGYSDSINSYLSHRKSVQMKKIKIVFLDSGSVGDTDLSPFSKLGDFISYHHTLPEYVRERAAEADVIITNKVKVMKSELDVLPNLKLICIAATGMNNVDLEEAERRGIPVKNVSDYSTDSVAQLTLTMALCLVQRTGAYDKYVKSGKYCHSQLFTNHSYPFFEISGKKWGIIGMGSIGKRVATLAEAFGAEVLYHSTSGQNLSAGFPHLSLKELLAECDIVSIHAPLNEQTNNLIGYKELCLMKPTTFLINVGRGGIVDEADLARALQEKRLAGAGVDVFSQEPILKENPLLTLVSNDNLLLTPHIAWASAEARERLINLIAEHIRTFFCK